MDFTLSIYQQLITSLQFNNYSFQSVVDFVQQPDSKSVVLRHDIDKLPANALKLAQMEHELGMRGSYFFRVVPASFDEPIMTQIKELGHEIGYHYENLSDISKKNPYPGGIVFGFHRAGIMQIDAD